MPIGIFSKGIIKSIPYIDVFLEDEIIFNPKKPDRLTAIAGWGYKFTSKKAIKKAEKWELPYIALEDGFIRSIGLGFEEPPLSLIIDPVGIYYDSTKPSFLENILNSDGWQTEELLNEARKIKEMITKYNISKYNNSKPVPIDFFKEFKNKEKVLVIDQTKGDASVILGGANQKTFKEMYLSAVEENPDSVIFIKTHPDVIKGKKKGYLTKFKKYPEVFIISENYNPIQLLKAMDKVYTVSSQMGFEALILEKEVYCFGLPFYAGWGLTKDRKKIERRKKQRNIYELISACYILYTKYINPYTKKELSNVFEVIEYINQKKSMV